MLGDLCSIHRSYNLECAICQDDPDPNQYELVESIQFNGREAKVGDVWHCSCDWVVSRLHPVWHSETGKHWPEHANNGLDWMLVYSQACPVHSKLATPKP